jgi:hypothetical protein
MCAYDTSDERGPSGRGPVAWSVQAGDAAPARDAVGARASPEALARAASAGVPLALDVGFGLLEQPRRFVVAATPRVATTGPHAGRAVMEVDGTTFVRT